MPRRKAAGLGHRAGKAAPPRPAPEQHAAEGPLDLSGVTRCVGPMLRLVQVRTFQKYYASDIEVSPGVLTSLTLIRDNPGIPHGVLADALVVQRPNMTKLVGYLVRHGLILRRTSSQDGRKITLHITSKGKRLLERGDAANEAHEAGITAALTAGERAQLLRLLGKLAADLIDQPSWKSTSRSV